MAITLQRGCKIYGGKAEKSFDFGALQGDKGKLKFYSSDYNAVAVLLQRTPKTSKLHDIKNSLYPNALKYSEHY